MEHKLNPTINTGFLEGSRPTDWLGGTIPHEQRNITKDWEQFLSIEERQNYTLFDAMECVSQSSTNAWEAQANQMLKEGLWPQDALKFWNKHGYIVNGKFEVSHRFTAKMSGTTRAGNYFFRVLDSLRLDGVIPEHKWTYQEGMDWDAYYAEIPEELKLLAKESLKYHSFAYENIAVGTEERKLETIKKTLEHTPIVFGIATCQPWDEDVPVCGFNPNHAVMCYRVNKDNSFMIFDSYLPYKKRLEFGYQISSAYKAVIYPVKRIEAKIEPGFLTEDIKFGESGLNVLKLKDSLNKLGWKTKDGDIYNKDLVEVVLNFQKANLNWMFNWFIAWDIFLIKKGKVVDKQTREVINKSLKNKYGN